MSHFGRSGPPDIRDTYSLLVLNITFRTTADDLFPLFDKYGKVVDVFIPRDRRTGDSRGFAFVRYKYADEAQKAVEKLDGRVVDGREIMVQFAKYGPNAERIHKGRIVESSSKLKGRSRSRSPRPRHRDEYRDRDRDRDRDRRRSRSRSRDRYDRDRYHRSDNRYRSRSHSASPDHSKDRGRGRYDDERRSRSQSYGSASPARRSPKSRRSPSPRRTPPRVENPEGRNFDDRSPAPKDVSPRGRPVDSRSPSPHRSDADE
ncbi:serine/arginine-rich splicing factor SC35 [Ziziphus jujuba]|uniref:Serine/arginine-rich splicing factor SC35 n=1 Tax=Ziziphus jujuba TaxID=326968 RepID=A0A6P3ZY12_ZIZJJ|nr:serine/arginine-rich splicing factor SC35 [Ziziphus jujuba]